MSEMLKLMTCGSRSVSDKELVFSELDKFRKKNPSLALISGGAKGADTITEEWVLMTQDHIQEKNTIKNIMQY